jgi:phosphatidate cytidylyltransferase
LPLAATLALPVVAVATRGPHALQARIAQRLWGVMLAGWCLSHVPALVRVDLPGHDDRGLLLVVFAVIVTQSSDVLQYVFGKLYGRRRIAPVVSPDKTVEGYLGGTLAASAIGTALWWMTPFAPWQAALVAWALTQLGFVGGLVLSALKRDLGRKDWGEAIRGHGGVLDRVDSLCLSAPVLFHAVRLAAA